jgi:hypothetical protein
MSHYDGLVVFPDPDVAQDHAVDEDIRKSEVIRYEQLRDLNNWCCRRRRLDGEDLESADDETH